MAQKLPLWLNEKFLAAALQGREEKEPRVSIIQFCGKPAVSAGNNYMSNLLRVQVNYKNGESSEQSVSLIVKEPITEGVIVDAFGDIDLYAIEPKIYNELLPKMNKLVRYEFGPKSFHCLLQNGLVLEDLNPEGYVVCNKYDQLDYSHCKYTLTVLAKFHAASVACYNNEPKLIESVGKERVFVEGGPLTNVMSEWIHTALESVAEIIDKKDICKPAAKLIRSRADSMSESLLKICQPKKKGLNVLNHGDLWINNILFKHNSSGEIIDLKLIDFQLARYGSPVLDLLYFIWTSANESVRENKVQELYDVYLHVLNNTLKELGCQERLSQEELQKDLKSAIDWAMVNICYDFPMLVCEAEDAVDFEDLNTEDIKSGSDAKLQKLYTGKHFNALIPNLMKQFYVWASS